MTSQLRGFSMMLSTGQVADIFGVNVRTIARWTQQGKLEAIKTPGGHNRYFEHRIRALIEAQGIQAGEELESP